MWATHGNIVGDTYFTIRKPRHFMVKFQGFGISQKILFKLSNLNVKFIKIKYLGKKKIEIFNAKVEDYLKSEKLNIFEGEDLQYFLSTNEMEAIK